MTRNSPKDRKHVLHAWLGARHLTPDAIARYAASFRSGEPFPHLLLRDILRNDVFIRLESSLARTPLKRKESDLFSFWQSDDLTVSNDPFVRKFIAFLRSDDLRAYLEAIIGVSLAHGAIDCAATRYDDTDYLLCHDDRLEHRKLAYVLYVGESFTPKDGGALCLYDSDASRSPTTIVQRYPPRRNSLALFLVSPISHHAVSENVRVKPRVAISGWFRG